MAKSLSGITAKAVAAQQYDLIGLNEYWGGLFGDAHYGFVAMVHGSPGSGKSTLLLSFANYLAKFHHFEVAYISFEEERRQTMTEKLNRLGIKSEKIHIFSSIEEMKDYNRKLSEYGMVILDSVQTGKITPTQLKKIVKNNPNTCFLAVFQATKNGKFKGNREFEHDVDVVVNVSKGKADSLTKNRLGKGRTVEIAFE